jgi:hypothetical protein
MTEAIPIVRRIREAKESAIADFREMGYEIIKSDNEVFCFIASKAAGPTVLHECKVRVVVDKITDHDQSLVKRQRLLPSQTKVILCREFGHKKFIRIELDYLNNPCQ